MEFLKTSLPQDQVLCYSEQWPTGRSVGEDFVSEYSWLEGS